MHFLHSCVPPCAVQDSALLMREVVALLLQGTGSRDPSQMCQGLCRAALLECQHALLLVASCTSLYTGKLQHC